MMDLDFAIPKAAGAARVRLIDPDGYSVDALSTPFDNTVHLPEATFGLYTAVVEPLGQRPRVYNFEFGPDSGVVEIASLRADFAPTASWVEPSSSSRAEPTSPTPAPTGRLKPLFPGHSSPEDPHSVFSVMTTPSKDPFFFLGERARSHVSAPAPSPAVEPEQPLFERPVSLSIGLANDTRPLGPGGWRPYCGLPPDIVQDAEGVSFVFPRTETPLPPPDQGGRLRLSILLTDRRLDRLLVPLFVGGVRVSLTLARGRAPDVALSITPLDPERLALAQALDAGFSGEGQAIFEAFTSVYDIERYIRDDSFFDPWTAILAALLTARFTGVGPSGGFTWIEELSSRFGWITDAQILDAQMLMHDGAAAEGGPARDYQTQALRALRRGRQVGAPYFHYASSIAAELLAALVGNAGDDPSDSTKGKELTPGASEERARWQRFIYNQRRAGAFFTWRARQGAKLQGGLDRRYNATIWRGVLDNHEIRAEP